MGNLPTGTKVLIIKGDYYIGDYLNTIGTVEDNIEQEEYCLVRLYDDNKYVFFYNEIAPCTEFIQELFK